MTDTQMTEWEAKRAADKKALEDSAKSLRQYAGKIAVSLGDWKLKPIDPEREHTRQTPHLYNPETGAEFWISSTWRNDGKLAVHGCWPKNAHGREEYPYFSQYSDNGPSAPTIGFSRTKSADAAARDIRKRFLSAYLPLWDKQSQMVAQQNESRLNRNALAGTIAALLLGKVQQRDEKPATVYLGYRSHGISEVDFDSNPDALKVTLHCTLTELQALARMFPYREPE